MKLSTATILAVLATVSGQVASRKTRGRRLNNDPMPYEMSGKGKGSSSSDEGKGGKGSSMVVEEPSCVCDGFFYYKFIDFGVDTPWIEAYKATPDDCVLSPVADQGELLEIGEAALERNAWVGIIKGAGAIADFPNTPLTAGWHNLDGSAVPDCDDLWGANRADDDDVEPNNNPAYQTRAHWFGENNDENEDFIQGLRDHNAVNRDFGIEIRGAVYKCCGENVNTCINFGDEDDEEDDGMNSTMVYGY